MSSIARRLAIVGLLAASCGGLRRRSRVRSRSASVGPSPAGAIGRRDADLAAPVKLVVGLGYIPSVQFAPVLPGPAEGYYAEPGSRSSSRTRSTRT